MHPSDVSPGSGALELQSAHVSCVILLKFECGCCPAPVLEGQCGFAGLCCTEAIPRQPVNTVCSGVWVDHDELFPDGLPGKIKVKCSQIGVYTHVESYSDPFCVGIAEKLPSIQAAVAIVEVQLKHPVRRSLLKPASVA